MRTNIAVFLLEQAANCRRLASRIGNKHVATQLLFLAESYEMKANDEPSRETYSGRLHQCGQ